MADNFKIGAGLALDGETEFKRAISGINKDLSVLGSEMKKVTAQYSDNADSIEALTAKQDVYNKRADEQKKKIDTITTALENAKKEYGENSDQVKNWQIKLNNAEADLSKTESSLKKTTDQINDFGKESDDSGKEIESAGKKAKSSGDDAEKGKSGWSKLGDGLKSAGELAGKAVLALGTAAVGAATGVAAMTVNAAKSADDINTLAKQTGLSTEEIQKFQYASELIDVPLDTLTGSMAKLTKNMATAQGGTGDAADAFKALGVSITDQNGELRNNQDVFNDAINALGNMQNETQRDAYAMQIFGKSAQDLNPLILGGADALTKYGQEAEDAGLILKQDALDNLNSLSDAMDTFENTASGSGSLFATAFAGPMADALNMLTGYMKDLTSAFNDGGISGLADELGNVLTDITKKVTDYLPKVIDFGLQIVQKLVEGIVKNIPAIISSAMDILLSLTNAIINMLPMILQAGMQIIMQLADGIADALPELIPVAIDMIMQLVNSLLENLPLIIEAAINIVVSLVQGLADALPQLIAWVPTIIMTIIDVILKSLPMLIDMVPQIIVSIITGLIQALPQLIAAVPQIIMAIITGLVGALPQLWTMGPKMLKEIAVGLMSQDWGEIGSNIIKGIVDGFTKAWDWVKEKISDIGDMITNGFKDFFGIHSPSTLFAEMGGYMAQGLGNGFENRMLAVARQMQNSVPTNFNVSTSGNDERPISTSGTVKAVLQSGNITVQQYFTGKTPSPAENARQTKNSLRQLALQLG